MVTIDFCLIGAHKAATTTLFELLAQHPALFLPPTKEDYYFAKDDIFARGQEHLALLYRGARPEQKLGHVYVNLMYWADVVIPRMRAHNPDMKLLALLRDPVDRAYSAYWYARQRGWEMAPSFEEGLENERQGRISSEFAHRSNLTYLAHGHYAEQLEGFRSAFGAGAVRVYFQEDLRRDARAVCADLFGYLGVATDVTIDPEVTANAAGESRLPALSRAINNDSPVKRLYHGLIPYSWRFFVSRRILSRLHKVNRQERANPPMSEQTRAALVEYYRPHNERLRHLVGRAF